jgi:hypothetical protein
MMRLLSGSSQTPPTDVEIGTSNLAPKDAPNWKLTPKGPDIESEHRRSAHLLAPMTYLLFQRMVGYIRAKFKMARIKMDVNIEGHPYHGSPFPDPLSLRVAKTVYSNMPATLPRIRGQERLSPYSIKVKS